MKHKLKLVKKWISPYMENAYECKICGGGFVGKDIKQARRASELQLCTMQVHEEWTQDHGLWFVEQYYIDRDGEKTILTLKRQAVKPWVEVKWDTSLIK